MRFFLTFFLCLCVFNPARVTFSAESSSLTPVQLQNDLQLKKQLRDTINQSIHSLQHPVTTSPPETYATPLQSLDNGPSFFIKSIRLDSNGHHEYDKQLNTVISRYRHTMIDANDIFSLLRETTNVLSNQGLVTSTVELIPGNLQGGEINIRIHWGYVQGWLIDGKQVIQLQKRIMLEQAIPSAKGRLLNMHDIDQALENINNGGQSARIDILPSVTPGYSWLNVTLLKRDASSLTASFDNSGNGHNPREGLYRYSLNSASNNILAGVDSLSLMFSTHHIQYDGGNADYYTGISYTVPLGYTTLELQGSHSRYRKPLTGYYGEYLSEGSSSAFCGRLSRTVFRDQTNKISLVAGLQHRNGRNYIAGTFINVNSIPYTTLTFGGQYVSALGGGSFYSDLTWNKGVAWWKGERGAINNYFPTMTRYLSLNTAWDRSFTLFSRPFSFSAMLNGQYSPDILLNDSRLAVGDDYTVRGFKGDPFLADSGMSLNNTLNLPAWTPAIFSITPFLGLDVAWLEKDGGDTTTLVGSALGLNTRYHSLSGSFSIGIPLHYDHGSAMDIDRWVATFSTHITL